MNVLSMEEFKRLVHLFVSGLTFIPRKVNLENWSLQVSPKRTHLVWGGSGGYQRHYLSHEHYRQIVGFKI